MHVTNTNMAATLAQFHLFVRERKKLLKEVKIITTLIKLRAAATQKQSWSVHKRMLRRHMTFRCVVFLNMHFQVMYFTSFSHAPLVNPMGPCFGKNMYSGQ